MSFEKLPRHAVIDIIRYITDDDYTRISKILSFRLVCKRLNAEILHVVYGQDAAHIHYRITIDDCVGKPNGVSLERFVRGFIGRPKCPTHDLNPIWRALRDGVWILSVWLDSLVDNKTSSTAPDTVDIASDPSPSASNQTDQTHEEDDATDTSREVEAIEPMLPLPDQALSCISRAYIDLLGDDRAFDSLDTSWRRSPTDFTKLNDKTGLFWAFLAAVHDGRPHVVNAAIKACNQRFRGEGYRSVLRMHLAAGLIVAARRGNVPIVETLLKHKAAKISLRFQNIRFAGENAMDAAIMSSQLEVIELLLQYDWDMITLPMDYVRALRATAGSMEMSFMRSFLLHLLMEEGCQKWRSNTIITGLYHEFCKQGDLKMCRRLKQLLQDTSASHDRWEWTFITGEDDNIAVTSSSLTHDEDELGMDHAANDGTLEEKTSLFIVVSRKHYDMITFLFENRESLPDSMSDNFSVRTRLRCLEHAVKHEDQTALTNLLPHIGDVCPRKLFLYATVRGNVPAMTSILPLVNLDAVVNEAECFFYFAEHDSDLSTVLQPLEETLHPNNFLFQSHRNQSRNVKLGTFALLCAIKTLQIPATELLLSKNCTIGTRLFLISANLIDCSFARVYFPHDLANCTECQQHISKVGKWVLLLAFTRCTYLDWKHMMESGAEILTTRSLYITKKNWWRIWQWRKIRFDKMDARIISGIQVPWEIYGVIDDGDLEKRFYAMQDLLKKWNLPHIFTDAGHEDRW